MNTKTKLSKSATIVQQQRKILELEAQLSSMYHFANVSLDKASTKHLMASGVLLQLSGIGGKDIIPPIVIKDGLSDATIEALRADIKRSWELATLFKV